MSSHLKPEDQSDMMGRYTNLSHKNKKFGQKNNKEKIQY